MNDDMALVQEYVASQSEPAFATLVARHLALVHSAALRQVEDAHLAEEITQAVFVILARKAGSLGPDTILSAWLYRTTGYVAAEIRRSHHRRRQREHEAHRQFTLHEAPAGPWEQLAPLLDQAMAGLGKRDRNALVLRFFENKTAPEIAAALRVNEEAAQKRVVRALDKLRKLFGKNGVTLTTAVIAGAMAASAVQAAPAELAGDVAAIAVAKGAAVSGSTLTLIKGTMKTMAWAKIKTAAAITAASVLTVGTTAAVIAGLAQPARGAAADLPPKTFVTTAGTYQWTNASAIGELTFRAGKTRSITLGTSALPPAGTMIVNRWTNPPSASTLIIQSDHVKFETAAGAPGTRGSTDISVGTGPSWRLGPHWFVYRADGMRVWAYDGDRSLWMLTATPQGGESTSIETLPEEPPAEVLRRLPAAVRKLLPHGGE